MGKGIRIIRDVETARSTVLKRTPLESLRLPSALKSRIAERFGKQLSPEEVVSGIISDVQRNGDKALLQYTEHLDGAVLSSLEVPRAEIDAAKSEVDRRLMTSMWVAAEKIEDFHRKQRGTLPLGRVEYSEGVGQLLAPLERVGVYAPGGTASYPSTVLMTVIPAKAAGVDEVILATPPKPDGHIPPLTLAAAAIAGADRVFSIGGAPAIAALAYGTESVPRVDKICGPGNIFVTLAKKQVFGAVDIDGLQGPTETIVLADASANASMCAADLLAQAEHDELASAIMITTSHEVAEKVVEEVERQMAKLERSGIAAKSLEGRGGIVVVDGMEVAIRLVNEYAPEHLCLLVEDGEAVAGRIRHAGGIFIGDTSPEVLGDYVAGPSHVMPTGGTARFSSPLNVMHFLKLTSIVALDEAAFDALRVHAANLARSEGLTGHAAAVDMRVK